MNKATRTLSSETEYVTMDQAKEIYNLGMNTLKDLCDKSGATRKIGKSVRINRKILSDYIEKNFA